MLEELRCVIAASLAYIMSQTPGEFMGLADGHKSQGLERDWVWNKHGNRIGRTNKLNIYGSLAEG